MSPNPRRTTAAALAVMALLAITGCTRATEGDHLTAEDASEQMQSLVRDTIDIADGVVDDPKAVVERVERAWQDRGLSTWTRSVERADGKILYRVGSQDAIVDTIQFAATTGRMSIEVDSLCGSGNVDDYYNDIE